MADLPLWTTAGPPASRSAWRSSRNLDVEYQIVGDMKDATIAGTEVGEDVSVKCLRMVVFGAAGLSGPDPLDQTENRFAD